MYIIWLYVFNYGITVKMAINRLTRINHYVTACSDLSMISIFIGSVQYKSRLSS